MTLSKVSLALWLNVSLLDPKRLASFESLSSVERLSPLLNAATPKCLASLECLSSPKRLASLNFSLLLDVSLSSEVSPPLEFCLFEVSRAPPKILHPQV